MEGLKPMNISIFENLINFWFQEKHKPNWFAKDPAFDQLIIEKFEPLYISLKDQKLDAWLNKSEILLALVILFDQFPRNMYRGTAKSFETDAKALDLTQYALRKNMDVDLTVEQKQFLYMPLMHSESLVDQALSIKLFGPTHTFAQSHFDIIKKFGRFPHRNDILGRSSTPAELEFLKGPGSSF
jgi:uncharacterized protein (DUF924 family)